jgi:hypothetical protein
MHTKNANWNFSQTRIFLSYLSYGSCDFMFELYSKLGLYTTMEVLIMTKNFVKKIGENCSGTMYRGKLQTRQNVAVKVWELRSHSAAEEFDQFQKVRNLNA